MGIGACFLYCSHISSHIRIYAHLVGRMAKNIWIDNSFSMQALVNWLNDQSYTPNWGWVFDTYGHLTTLNPWCCSMTYFMENTFKTDWDNPPRFYYNCLTETFKIHISYSFFPVARCLFFLPWCPSTATRIPFGQPSETQDIVDRSSCSINTNSEMLSASSSLCQSLWFKIINIIFSPFSREEVDFSSPRFLPFQLVLHYLYRKDI